MLHLLILGVLAFVGAQGAPQEIESKTDLKIINGTNAEPGQYPYQISLQYMSSHFCGGFIVSSKWSVTAGHCVEGLTPSDMSVLAGTISLSEGGVRREVENLFQHEQYNADDNWKNDIALIKVASPFEFNSYIQPIKMPNPFVEVPSHTPVTVTGWGRLETGGPSPDILQTVDIMTFSDEECRDKLYTTIHDGQICAGLPEGNKGECNGDSGSALASNGVAVGIVSWSFKPCTKPPFQYGVYTQVSHYVDWIDLTIWANDIKSMSIIKPELAIMKNLVKIDGEMNTK